MKKILIAIAIYTLSQVAASEELSDELHELVSISTGNLICGMYGEFTSEKDAPIVYGPYYEMSKSLAAVLLRKRSGSKQDVEEGVAKHHDGIRSALLKQYKEGGPAKLKYHFNDFMKGLDYTKPSWISSCDDLYNYSKSLVETEMTVSDE